MHVEALGTCKNLETAKQGSHCHIPFAEIFDDSKPAEKTKEFTVVWEKYLSQLQIDTEPMDHQHVTEEMFEAVIEKQITVTKGDKVNLRGCPLKKRMLFVLWEGML